MLLVAESLRGKKSWNWLLGGLKFQILHSDAFKGSEVLDMVGEWEK